MSKLTRITATLLIGTAALTACTPGQHHEEATFPFSGNILAVTNPNTNMPVSVTHGPADQVNVTLDTQTMGKSANTPDWHLEANTLNVGSPCNKGYVGYCEGSYRITVPSGTTVNINGSLVPVR